MIREAATFRTPAILELWLEEYNWGASLYKSELLA